MKQEEDFLWGVVNIGQQTEGACPESNWHAWQQCDLVPQYDAGNDYWQRYKEDHDLVEELGCNAMRVSLDWARIEPEEGVYDDAAIARYKEILEDLKERNIVTVVGLWHWTVPVWLEKKYGMHHIEIPQLFERFVRVVRDRLGVCIDYVIVLNEPSVYICTSYLRGTRPPFLRSVFYALKVVRNMIAMHKNTYHIWKGVYPDVRIGSTHLYNDIGSANNTVVEKIAVKISAWLRIGFFIGATKMTSDFIGINYYTSDKIYFQGLRKMHTGVLGFHGTNDWHSPDVWRHFAEGFKRVLVHVGHFGVPIIICEHGKPTNPGREDDDRVEFLKDGVNTMYEVMRENNVDVQGYFHYALTDAYEWDSGYDFKFGLVEIDRKTLVRTKRKSFYIYKKIIHKDEVSR